MPFKSIGSGKYKSPSGRVWTKKAVKWWYANKMENKPKYRVKK